MEAYKRWVRRNKDYVHSLETLANGLTWILPERFSDSEIGAEAVTSILGILTTINDHIIETTPTKPVIIGEDEPTPFPYSLSITLLKDLETLVEVAAQHFLGDDKKWNFICVTEAIKSMFRLNMFRNSGYKMLLHGGETVNTEKEPNASNPNPRYGATLNGYLQTPTNLEGRALSALNRFGANARTVSEPTWLSRLHHHQTSIQPPIPTVNEPMKLSTLLSEKGVPGGLFVMGEVMFIIRPLLYVLLIKKYGVRSWLPWFTSLSVDLVGNGILAYVTMVKHRRKEAPPFRLSDSEKNELKRRKLLWALYVMRDPFFTKYTRKKLERTQTMLEPVPIVAFFTEKLIELIIGAQTRYTYMSGS